MSNPRPHTIGTNDLISLGNRHIEFGFSRMAKGALVSIIDKKTGKQFISKTPDHPMLYRLGFRAAHGEIEYVNHGEAASLEWEKDTGNGATTLTILSKPCPSRPLTVEISIRLEEESPPQLLVYDRPKC